MREPTKTLMRLLGYRSLYPPQEEALRAGVEHGRSVLVATPTASGKTFVGLVAIANRLAGGEGLAVYTVPLRSIAMEKGETMRVLERMGLRVAMMIGDMRPPPGRYDVLLATYEKLDSLLRHQPGLLERLRVLVVDEVHYIGDPKRGIILESVLARVLAHQDDTQIVALSATVPNAGEIASWLGAAAIISDWRPVPLREAVYKGGVLHYPREGSTEEVPRATGKPLTDLIVHRNSGGGQLIVFSMSRRRTVQLAQQTARHRDKLHYDEALARRVAAEIMRTGGPRSVRELLAGLISRGVAFHHAGLSNEQRRLVEEAFRRGAVAVIHATPTLAAGVNLPARHVVVEEYYRFEQGYRRPIPVSEYKQLSGRAGRPGFDREGEAIIVASQRDSVEEVAQTYILSPPEPVESRLNGIRGLRHVLLGLAAGGPVGSEELARFAASTLYARQAGARSLALALERALGDLQEWGLIRVSGGVISPTVLGVEVARVYLDPESVRIARDLLSGVEEPGLMLLLYTIARMPDAVTLPVSRREHEKLLDLLVEEYPDLLDAIEWFGPEEARAFKTALLLRLWVEEAGEDVIHRETGAGPGDIASIVETSAWIAGSLHRVAPHLGLPARIGEELGLLQARIKHGVRPELLPLVVIPGVGRVRARRLYNAGYRTLADLATASPRDLLRVPGIGASTVRSILEFFGRTGELEEVPAGGGRGLDAFL